MPRYRKKPVVIDAIQWNGSNKKSIVEFLNFDTSSIIFADDIVTIKTLEGDMRANINDWIVCGVKGEYYPVKPDIFSATYEEMPV